MKPVFQNRFGEGGNCLEACVASLLEISLDEVGYFGGDKTYESGMAEFLASRGYIYVLVDAPNKLERDMLEAMFAAGNVYHIMEGVCKDGAPHAIIGLNGEQDFDPHPEYVQHESGPGLKRVDGWGFVLRRL